MKKILAALVLLGGAAVLGGKAQTLGNKATIYDRTGLYPKAQIKKDAFQENSWTIYDKNGFIPEGKIKLRPDGKYYILNGQKQFITNAGIADMFTTYAKVDGNKFSAFIVERKYEGVSVDEEENKMGVKGSSTRSVIFSDVKVPWRTYSEKSEKVTLWLSTSSTWGVSLWVKAPWEDVREPCRRL